MTSPLSHTWRTAMYRSHCSSLGNHWYRWGATWSMPAALFLGGRSAFVKDCQEGGSGLTGRPGFKTCERRALTSSGLHGGSPAKCGRCSAAEVVSGCGVVVRKGVISHHFRALKKVERPRTAHFRKRLMCRWARFILLFALWCAQACWALLEVELRCNSSTSCCSATS